MGHRIIQPATRIGGELSVPGDKSISHRVAMLAAVAGALYVPQVGIINPGEFSPLNSIEMVVWVATGGRGTLFGAIVGAFSVNYAKTFFTTFSPETWLFILGGLFVLVTLLLPKGIVGLFDRFSRKGDKQ